jgi:hypothetical protein
MSNKPDDLEAVRGVVEALKPFEAAEQERILRWAREKLGLQSSGAVNTDSAGAIVTPAAAAQPLQGQDIKSFIDSKSPQSDQQFTAAVAYYYRFVAKDDARKEVITSEDLVNAARMVNWSRPSRPAQTLGNAHAAGYLDKAAHGSYAINAVGENLVAMAMPGGAPPQSRKVKAKAKRKLKAKARSKRK